MCFLRFGNFVLAMSSFGLALCVRVGAAVLTLWAGTASAQSPATARGALFDIWEYEVHGNSLLTPSQIEQAVTPYLGPQRQITDVDAARGNLQQRYQDAGYLSVQVLIPEQKVDDGVVRLAVVEATLSALDIAGAQYNAPRRVAQAVPALQPGTVPNFSQVQAQLDEINRRADIKVSPVLKAGALPGTVAAQLDVDDQLALHGSLEVNTKQSLNTSGLRVAAALRYDDLWAMGHSLGLNFQYTPEAPQEVRATTVNYSVPTGLKGESFSGYLSQSRSNMNIWVYEGMGVVGNTDVTGLRYTWPLSAPDGQDQNFSLSVDHRDSRGMTRQPGSEVPQPAIRYAPVGMVYRIIDKRHEPSPSVLDVSSLMGVRGVAGLNQDSAFAASRPGASANFAVLRMNWQSSRSLGVSSLGYKVDAQLASGPLLSSERFYAGGVDSVRGYYESERVADQGLRAALEWGSPWVRQTLANAPWRWQLLAFTDGAWVQNLPPIQAVSQARLWSVGGGMRWLGPRGLGLNMDVARALLDGDTTARGTRRGDWRAHVRLYTEF